MPQTMNKVPPPVAAPRNRTTAEEVANIAVFRSGEIRRMSRSIGFDVAVIAVVDDPDAAAAGLSKRWHGAFSPRERWVLPFDTFDAMPWTVSFGLLAMDERWLGPHELPPGLSISDGLLKVALPPGARAADFAVSFRAAMEDLAFERVAARPARVDWRFRTGRPLVVGSRYCAPARGWQLPPLATGIYIFRPKGIWWIVERALAARTLVGVRAALRSPVRHASAHSPG